MSILFISLFIITQSSDVDRNDSSSNLMNAPETKNSVLQERINRALSAESQGDSALRSRELIKSILIDPDNIKARGLLGFVRFDSKWIKPDRIGVDMARSAVDSALYKEYETIKSKTKNNADDQWKTAIWCEEHGLSEEARAHFQVVGYLDPTRTAAWNKLGFKKYHGEWMSESDRKEMIAEEQTRRKADEYWTKRLSNWKKMLAIPSQRDRAHLYLSTVDDPTAVPSIRRILIAGDADCQIEAIKILKKIDTIEASVALSTLLIHGRNREVVDRTSDELKKKPIDDYLPFLISRLTHELKYEIHYSSLTGMPDEMVVDFGDFFVKRKYEYKKSLPQDTIFMLNKMKRLNIDPFDPSVRNYLESHHVTALENFVNDFDFMKDDYGFFNPKFAVTGKASTGILFGKSFYNNIDEYQRSNMITLNNILTDIEFIKIFNGASLVTNQRIIHYLVEISGKNFGANSKDWMEWFIKYSAYSTASTNTRLLIKPIFDQLVPNYYTPNYLRTRSTFCFAKDTPVVCVQGYKSIQSLKPGDLILSQDVTNGELSFKPVLRAISNPPQPAIDIDFGRDKITSTDIHRFWISGKGWAPARDLHPGDRIRALNGVLEVKKIEHRPVQPVFNLVVAENHDFFVGHSAALVHDNDYAPRVERPFDRVSNDSR
jgi:hypothetical protein